MKLTKPLSIFVALTAVLSIAFAADQKISELTSLVQGDFATSDLLPIVDVSANQTKKTTIGDFDLRFFNKNTDILATARGGTGLASTASYPASGIVATVPGTGVVKSNGLALSAGLLALGSEVSGQLPFANGGTGLSATPANGQLLIGNGSGYALAGLTAGSGISITSGAGSITIATSGVGSVTEVALQLPSDFVVTGSPVTSSGTLSASYASQAQNLFFASPDGVSGAPSFRSVVLDDIPAIPLASKVSGELPVANGGTGLASFNSGAMLFASAPTTVSGLPIGISGTILTSNGAAPYWAAAPATGVTNINSGSGLLGGPITTSGTLSVDFGTAVGQAVQVQAEGKLPALDAFSLTGLNPANISGTVGLAKGGTGLSAGGSSDQILGMNNAGSALEYKSLVAGSNITITSSAGSITIAASGGGGSGTVETINTGVGLLGGPITVSGTLSVDVGTSEDQIVQVQAESKLPVLDAFNLTGLNPANISGVIGANKGGTGHGSLATGDILYASGSSTWNRLAAGSTGQILAISGGVPVWAPPSVASGGANTALSNLATTAINAPLIFGASGTLVDGYVRTASQATGVSADLWFETGDSADSNSGNMNFRTGVATTGGQNSGGFFFSSPGGTSTHGSGGFTFTSGDTEEGSTGGVYFTTGTATITPGNSGPIALTTGGGVNGTGNVTINTGNASIAGSGSINMGTGTASGSSSGSFQFLTGGSDASTGTIDLTTGNATGSDSGAISIVTGDSDTNFSGNIRLQPGAASTPSGIGRVIVRAGNLNVDDSHIIASQTTDPVATVNANAGTGASCTLTNATDVSGTLNLTTTNTSSASGIQCAVEFNKDFPLAPHCVIAPADVDSAAQAVAQEIYVTSTASEMRLNFGVAETTGRTYNWTFHCIGAE